MRKYSQNRDTVQDTKDFPLLAAGSTMNFLLAMMMKKAPKHVCAFSRLSFYPSRSRQFFDKKEERPQFDSEIGYKLKSCLLPTSKGFQYFPSQVCASCG